MSTAEEDIEAKLNELEEEHGLGKVLDEDLGGEEDPAPKPPGYIDNMDDWVAAGKDPDLFKGKKAYEAEYERIQEIRELKETMKQVVDSTTQWKAQQEQQLRAKIEEEMRQAEEDEDIAAYKRAQDKLKTIPTEAPKTPPVLDKFFQKHPILDRTKPEFNQDFYNDMAIFHDSMLDGLTPERRGSLTEDQINRFMTLAYNKAKDLHPEKFKSQKNSRQGAPSSSQRSNGSAPAPSKLSSVGGNRHNKRDTNPAMDIYEDLKRRDPKAAEIFAKNVLGE